jgi:hypothetical protein
MAVEQSVIVEGEGHSFDIAGGNIAKEGSVIFDIDTEEGDIIFEQLKEETDFFKPNLEAFKPPKFIIPNITTKIIEELRKNKLIVLGGSNGIDKSDLARNLAWSLNESQKSESISEMQILEWNRSSLDLDGIEVRIRDTTAETIFIIPRISPQDIRYDLSSLKNAADKNGHYILISTEIPYPSWKLPKDNQHFWYDIPDDIYTTGELAQMLDQKVERRQAANDRWRAGYRYRQRAKIACKHLSIYNLALCRKKAYRIEGY